MIIKSKVPKIMHDARGHDKISFSCKLQSGNLSDAIVITFWGIVYNILKMTVLLVKVVKIL